MISLKQVVKLNGGARIIDALSLEVPAGNSVVVLGPSGTGKTTLLRLIAGLEIPDKGEIYINGALASRPGWALAPHRRKLGVVFQTSALWPHMTVTQNILFGLNNLPGAEAQTRADDLLKNLGLSGLERRYPHQISGGEARRVAIARALAPRTPIVLMDEPLTNLDHDLKAKVLAFIKSWIAETKACLVYVTHDLEEARQISERVLELKNGKL